MVLFSRENRDRGNDSLRELGSNLYIFFEWVTRFAYLNILWILFTLFGGVIAGIYPSTTTVFAIMRKWLAGEDDLPIFKTFWSQYKKDFLKSNYLGVYFNIILVFILMDLFYLYNIADSGMKWTAIPLSAGILFLSFLLLYLFPVFVHYDQPVRKTVRTSFLLMLISPLQIFVMLISLLAIAVILWIFPAIGFIFGMSLYAFVTIWASRYSFKRLEQKQA